MLRRIIDRPIAVTMIVVTIVIMGLISLNLLPVSLVPDVNIPYITVRVTDPGKSAKELHERVVNPLRQQFMQMSGVNDIRTETKDGSGVITLTFEHGSNTDYLFIEANEKIDRAMALLPKELERPRVMKARATDIPAFYINLTVAGEDGVSPEDGKVPVSSKFEQLSGFANNVISKRIEQLPEVAMVDLSGYVLPEIMIIPDKEKLRRMNVTQEDFERVIRTVNINIGNLTIRDGEYQYSVNLDRRAGSKEDIGSLYLKISGRLLQIRDLAQVIEQPRSRQCIVSSDLGNAVTLAVIKQSEVKMSRLKKNLNLLLEDFSLEYPDICFSVTRDQTELLDYSIDNLLMNIILGIVLAALVILLFMKNFFSSLLIIITIPLSLLLSLLVFHLAGISINIISLSGLLLGVGMIVDNSIILIDNMNFKWRSGTNVRTTVVEAVKEVFSPMLSSVLTTCSVFIPLIFLSGIAGAIFYDQAMAVTITLFSSLLVTVTVIPVYYLVFFGKKVKYSPNNIFASVSLPKRLHLYENILNFFFRRPYILYVMLAISAVGVILLFLDIPKERLPQITYTDTLVNIDWNERITVEENNRRANLLTKHIGESAAQFTVMSGMQQFILDHTRDLGNSESVVYIKKSEGNEMSVIKEEVSDYLRHYYPHASFSFKSSGNIFDMIFSEKEDKLVARLRTKNGKQPEIDELNTIIRQLNGRIPEVSLEIPTTENLVFLSRPDIMAIYDVSYYELNSVLKNALNGNLLFTVTQGNFSTPVIIGENKSGINSILESVTIRKNGVDVPLRVFFRQTMDSDLKTVISGPEGVFFPVSLDVADKEVPAAVETIKQNVEATDNFEVGFSGSYFSNRGMTREFVLIFLVALSLLYFILAAQFESLLQPLIILSEIIIDVFIILLVLRILGITINIMSMIGIIVTCGIIINDSILKIDTINKFRKEGRNLLRAIVEAGQKRLKAIIMTSLTTILAISPFLSRGAMGSDLQYPLSVSIIAGMIAGTFISLYLVPVLYYVIYRKKK